MMTFYPGPSKVYPEIKQFMADAMDEGILSQNHRSQPFINLCKETVALVKDRLDIPSNYHVYFTSSATECWEILSQSFAELNSLHLYNGAFGEKWMEYRRRLYTNTYGVEFGLQRQLGMTQLQKQVPSDTDILCLTSNETSNATKVSENTLKAVRERYRNSLIFVDATSSMGGVNHDWLSADVWYASVQKCLGLPSGLAVMVCSPFAVEQAQRLNHREHYNSFLHIHEQMLNYQTTHTPNILDIYLLKRVMEQRAPIRKVANHLKERMMWVNEELVKYGYQLLIESRRQRSLTVAAITAAPEKIDKLKKEAVAAGITLGNGYGKWKPHTLRMANFPAIEDTEVEQLLNFLKQAIK
ncbi:aminotransferase class V-fold PLP-dependent enzyme [Algivirga pacifica]|uniref:Aminotransferase class V domain-containing protein n=1 Tax=Algivirga pacifica TaxID=1162670 RepID=A0ABP9DCS1_9BACT